ncbi:hypothetical protein ACOSQ3_031852 [Xanthoceras sorbifolium]
MSGSSAQRSHEDRGAEASASSHQGIILPQRSAMGALILNQVDNLDHLKEVELTPSSFGQLLTLYLLFKRNGLPHPNDNVIKYCFALRQCLLPKGSPEDVLHDGMHYQVDFHASAKQNIQRMYGPTAVVGPAVFPSSNRGLGAVAKEYLDRALMLYEEFLIEGLSQRIDEDKGPDLRHTIVCHALLLSSSGSCSRLLAQGNPSVGCASAAQVGESLSILRWARRDFTLSVYISCASLRAHQPSGRRVLPIFTALGLSS